MDNSLIQPFVDETIRTFELMLGVTVTKVGEETRENPEGVHDVSATVGIAGSATGGVVLSMPKSAARKIASQLIGEQVDELSPDVKDVVGELANVVSARAKRVLEKEGLIGLRLSLPHVVVGKGRSVWLSRELPCVSVSLLTEEYGPFCIEISIRPVEGERALRAAVTEDAGEYGSRTATPGAETGEGRPAMRILLVDDSTILRKFVAAILADIDDMPVELIETATGPEALAAIEEHGSSIDLILCDLGIPEIDGLAVLEKVKAMTDARETCFVIITGDMSNDTVFRAVNEGAAGFLVKPFTQNELVRLVREVHSRLARRLPTATGEGLPLFRSAPETSGDPPSDDGPLQDGGS